MTSISHSVAAKDDAIRMWDRAANAVGYTVALALVCLVLVGVVWIIAMRDANVYCREEETELLAPDSV